MRQPTNTAEVPVSMEEPSWSSKSCGHSERSHADQLQLVQSLRVAQKRIPKAGARSLPVWMWLRVGQESLEGGETRSREETTYLQGVLPPWRGSPG